VGQCVACESDLDCAVGSACVAVTFPVDDGAEVGTYCSQPCDSGVANDCLLTIGSRGYACLTVTTRAGDEGEYCVPARTTCEGYRNAEREEACANRDECSADGAGPLQDAYCVDLVCSYYCESDDDCPPGAGCGDVELARCAP
jgi:hypothetical protein